MILSPAAVVQELYAAFGRGDLHALLAHLHPDIEWSANVDYSLPAARQVPCYEAGRGHAFVAEYFRRLAKSYEIHRFQPHTFMSDGAAEVAVRIDVDFTVWLTGRRLRTEVVHHWIVDAEGRVTRFRDFEDTLAWTNAWGA